MTMLEVDELGPLKAFAREVIECRTGCLEGCDIDDLALKYGLLEVVEATEPCCENCACAEFGPFPQECYRLAGILKGPQ